MSKLRKKDRGTADDRSAAGAPQMSGHTTAASIDRERLASRAYELYLARGGGDGHDMEDWLAAERELQQRAGTRAQES